MSGQHIHATRIINAPIEDVWALLSRVHTWTRWAGFDVTELEHAGEPDVDGVGAIRRFRLGKTATRETVTRFEPPHRFAYELLEGLPIRDYAAEVTLVRRNRATTALLWEAHFHARYPGTGPLIKRKLAEFLIDLTGKLQAAVEDPPTTRVEAHGADAETAAPRETSPAREAAAA